MMISVVEDMMQSYNQLSITLILILSIIKTGQLRESADITGMHDVVTPKMFFNPLVVSCNNLLHCFCFHMIGVSISWSTNTRYFTRVKTRYLIKVSNIISYEGQQHNISQRSTICSTTEFQFN
jgi:hypothetical protein